MVSVWVQCNLVWYFLVSNYIMTSIKQLIRVHLILTHADVVTIWNWYVTFPGHQFIAFQCLTKQRCINSLWRARLIQNIFTEALNTLLPIVATIRATTSRYSYYQVHYMRIEQIWFSDGATERVPWFQEAAGLILGQAIAGVYVIFFSPSQLLRM
jgi:hypothetical protein